MMTKMRYFLCLLLILSWIGSKEVHGLFCFKCLAVDCYQEDPKCQQVIALSRSLIKKLYFLDSNLEICPPLNETTTSKQWRIMQLQNMYNPCPEVKANEAACALGRIQIKTHKSNTRRVDVVNHATIMGCATRNLLSRLQVAQLSKSCDLLKVDHPPQNGVTWEAAVEHCLDNKTYCFNKDYCIDWKESAVKRFGDGEEKDAFFSGGIVKFLAILVLIGVVVTASGFLFNCCCGRSPQVKGQMGNAQAEIKELNFSESEQLFQPLNAEGKDEEKKEVIVINENEKQIQPLNAEAKDEETNEVIVSGENEKLVQPVIPDVKEV